MCYLFFYSFAGNFVVFVFFAVLFSPDHLSHCQHLAISPDEEQLRDARKIWRFDYSAVPGIPVLDRTDGLPAGHTMLSRPRWLLELVRRMGLLAVNFIFVILLRRVRAPGLDVR